MSQACMKSGEQRYPINVGNIKYIIRIRSYKVEKDFLNILYDSELRISKLTSLLKRSDIFLKLHICACYLFPKNWTSENKIYKNFVSIIRKPIQRNCR